MNGETILHPTYDLVTPDGTITALETISNLKKRATVSIQKISPSFVGFELEPEQITFNIKSSLAQLGVDATSTDMLFEPARHRIEVQVELDAIGPIGEKMLKAIQPGAYIGKLFAADDRRLVRDPDYIQRQFGRSDFQGLPLLSLGSMLGSEELALEKIDGRAVAYLFLQEGTVEYSPDIDGFIPTIAKALVAGGKMRELLKLHQYINRQSLRKVQPGKLLLVSTAPLHVRTLFARVVNDLLPSGFKHTNASILQPDTKASGDIYEFYGDSLSEINDVPLEFFSLEPLREHVFFSDKDQLQNYLEDHDHLFQAFKTAPEPLDYPAAVFVAKESQMKNLKASDWIVREPKKLFWPGMTQVERQALMTQRYVEYNPAYPFLKAMSDGFITSQGVLFSRYFPTTVLKCLLLSDSVRRCLKRLYFFRPSYSTGEYFTQEDRNLLVDLVRFSIPVFWVDERTGKVLQYAQRPERDSGMFVPINQVENFLKATVFGVYGSNLLEGSFEEELIALLEGILEMKNSMNHPLLNAHTPLALVTGGGPGAMEVGNRVAKSLKILSCAHVVDFENKSQTLVNEQRQNPYVEGKMTYCLSKIVERQAEFHLNFPIFLTGGYGTDFELTLEEVCRKVGTRIATPVMLFGTPQYWKDKIGYRFQNNVMHGTVKGSEWVSNSFFCVQNARQALHVYKLYFEGQLQIGKNFPFFEDGFVDVAKHLPMG